MGDWAVDKVIEVANRLAAQLAGQSEELVRLAEELQADVDDLAGPYEDIIEHIPVNPNPKDPPAWWIRKLSEIQGITIHHTLSHNPQNVARYVIESKGRPTLPYHFWVSQAGECWLCVPLTYGMWHDHTGHRNVNISIGMAGHLHKVWPTQKQLDATARLVRWLMREYEIPIEQVQGHKDRYASTVCPGWDMAHWREVFYEMIERGLEDNNG